MRASVLRAILAVALISFTGCSLGLRGPGRPTFNVDGTPAEPDCSSSNVAPTVDTLAALALIGLGAAMTQCSPEENVDPLTGLVESGACAGVIMTAVPIIGAGVGVGVVGLHGFSKTEGCREAKRKHRERLAESPLTHVEIPVDALPNPTRVRAATR